MVFKPEGIGRTALSGFASGLVACAGYDAERLSSVYIFHLWGDFFGRIDGWAAGTGSNYLAGCLWRYLDVGAGMGVVVFIQAAAIGVSLRPRQYIVGFTVAFAVFPVWTGLVLADGFAPAGRALFPLDATTLVLSLVGHLIFRAILGCGLWLSRNPAGRGELGCRSSGSMTGNSAPVAACRDTSLTVTGKRRVSKMSVEAGTGAAQAEPQPTLSTAAVKAVLLAVARFAAGSYRPEPLDYSRPDVSGQCRPPCRQQDRRIDRRAEPTPSVLAKLRAAGSSPGVLDVIGETEYYPVDGHEEDDLRSEPGTILARRGGAVCRATADGAVWVPHLHRRPTPGGRRTFSGPRERYAHPRRAFAYEEKLPHMPLHLARHRTHPWPSRPGRSRGQEMADVVARYVHRAASDRAAGR
jgi:hypothetical protein